MQFWITCILFFIAAFILMDLVRPIKARKNIRIAVYNKETGTKTIVTLDRGFDDEVDALIKELDNQDRKEAK